MKNRIISFVTACAILLCLVAVFSSCGSTASTGNTEEATQPAATSLTDQTTSAAAEQTEPEDTEPTELNQTGYPAGNVQREFIFLDGRLFVYADDFRTSLPSTYFFYGTVQTSDGTIIPYIEFDAANVPEGTELYVSVNENFTRVYAKISENRFELFVPYVQ